MDAVDDMAYWKGDKLIVLGDRDKQERAILGLSQWFNEPDDSEREGGLVGDVVVVPFSFTNLSEVKLRPAVVLADMGMSDWILCEVTSRRRRSGDIEIAARDSENRVLERESWARPSSPKFLKR